MDTWLYSTICSKDYFFLIEMSWDLCWKWIHLNIVFVCDSHSIPLVYVYSYNSTTHFDYCRSMLSSEKGTSSVRKCISMEEPFGRMHLPNVSLIVMINDVMLESWLCLGFWNTGYFCTMLVAWIQNQIFPKWKGFYWFENDSGFSLLFKMWLLLTAISREAADH